MGKGQKSRERRYSLIYNLAGKSSGHEELQGMECCKARLFSLTTLETINILG
jgi:hypothetical protein